MGLFSSTRGRERAKWFFVMLLGMTLIQLSRYFEVFPSIWWLVKAMGSGSFFFLG